MTRGMETQIREALEDIPTEEKILLFRELIFLKSTGRRPQRWIDIETAAIANGYNHMTSAGASQGAS